MNKHFRFFFIFLLLFYLSIPFVKAQTTFASENELIKQAAKLFEDEKFEEAAPLYSQLVSNYLKDPNYNFRLGVCLLFTSGDKEKPLPYLELAVNNPDVEKEVHYYLGKTYHLNYRFDDAIAQFQAYMKVAQPKNIEKFQVQRQIEMCVNGKKLLRNLSDLQVTEKKEMNREDFFRSYDISSIGGKLLVKPDEKELRTPLDKKKKEQSIIYLAKDKSQLYFSSYGLENTHGKDIYVIHKLPPKDSSDVSGEWGKSQALSSVINTKYDEDYPFLHPNGKVLYFSSKGHNSMGGYDIFKSKFNEETKEWNTPENLDFPINTPDDDILYVTDSSEKEAYFSSARGSASGKISVYHINVDRKPIDVVIIKGNLIKNRNNQALDVKITVKDLAANSILGIYNSSPDNGSYSLELPNGGSFSFTVEAAGFPTQSDVVIVPVQYKFNPMNQEISYDLVTSRLKIKNSFGAKNEDENYLLALNYIKNKSKLDVSLIDLSPIDSSKAEAATNLTAGVQKSDTILSDKKLSNDDIVKIAYEDAKDVDAEAKQLREQADIALNLANQKNELAQNKSKEASSYMGEASKTNDIVKKEEFFDKSDAASTEAKQLNQETVTAFNLAKKLDATAFKKQEEADISQQYAKELEGAVKSGNSPEALAKVEEQEKKLDELNKANIGTASISNSLKMEGDTKQRELNKTVQTSTDIKQEMVDNETVITNLKVDLEKTKNEELKQGLENQITELNQENVDKKIELKKNDIKVAKLQKEYDGILNETAMVNTVIDQSKTESSETASAGVASIDKNKLEKQVNSIAGVTPDSKAITVNTTPSGNNTSVSKQSGTAPVASATKPISTQSDEKSLNTKTETKPVATTVKPVTKAPDNTVSVSPKAEATPVTSTAKPAVNNVDNTTAINTKTEIAPITSTAKPVANNADNTVPVNTKTEIAPIASTAKPVANNADNTVPVNTKTETAPVASTAKPVANNADNTTTVNTKSETAPIASTTKPAVNNADNTTTVNTKAETAPIASTTKPSVINADNTTTVNTKAETAPIASTTKPAVNNADNTTTINTKVETAPIASTAKPVTNNADNTSSVNTKAETTPIASTAKPVTNTTDNTKSVSTKAETTPIVSTTKAVSATSDNSKSLLNNPVASTSKTPDEELVTLNKKNEVELASAEKIENKSDREKAKADVLQKWSKEIDADLVKQKQVYDTTSNVASKALLAKKISDAAVSSKEKQTKANESLAAIETLKQNSVATINNTSPETPTSPNIKSTSVDNTKNETAQLTKKTNDKALDKINKGNADDLAVAEKIVNKQDREKAKSAALKMWAEEIDAHTVDLQQKYWDETDSKKKSLLALQIADAEKFSKEMLSPKNTGIEKPNATPSTKPNATIASIVVLLPDEVFEHKSSPVYSAEKPIPINDKLPEGLIYKVQIGAFRKPIPQDLFVGMSPITGETTPQGFIRYTAGIFKNLSTAENIKNEIKSLGYKDAFIVAFNNGKRIPLKEASTISGTTPAVYAQAKPETTSPTNVSQLQKLYSDIPPATIANRAVEEQQKEIAPTENVKSVGGLFYTVQVGVFAQAVPSNKLFNIQPLYTETAPNGNLRYNIGIYNNLTRATEAKFMAIDVGLKDAYITAYYNGKRISMNEANQHGLEEGAMVFSKAPNINVLPFFGSPKQNVPESSTASAQQSLQTNPTPAIGNEKKSVTDNNAAAEKQPANIENQIYASTFAADVAFKIQLGAFRFEVPLDIVNKFLKISKLGVENYVDINGLTIFTAGDFKSYDDANKVKQELVADSFKDAFVVAYRNGKKISMDEAKK